MADGDRIIVDTLSAAHRNGYAIVAHCDHCGRTVYLHIPTVIALDGDRHLLDLRVRCRECGQRGVPHLVPITPAFDGYPRL